MLTVYTAVFGVTDPLHESVVDTAARFVCFTDNRQLTSPRWEMVYHEPTDHPTRQARTVKALSHRHTDTEWSLWMDANFALKVDPLILLNRHELTTFVHPSRKTLAAEGLAVLEWGKAKPGMVKKQLDAYQAEGFPLRHPPAGGLSCTGIVLRRHTARVCRFNETWQQQLDTYTLRDQLGVDYAAWKEGITPFRWPGHCRANPYFTHVTYDRPVNDF